MEITETTTDATKARLKAYVERIERLEEEKKNLAEDIREIYKEAKMEGFDIKVMRKVISLRKMDTEDRVMQEELLDIYKHALGMLLDN